MRDSIVGFKENPDGTLAFKNPISEQIWKDRYQHNDETLDENIKRVAEYMANEPWESEQFEEAMRNGEFFPAGRTMCNAGLGYETTSSNCFTLNGVPDSIEGIFDTVKISALTQKAGGGVGTDYSWIRPKGTSTHNDGIASGPVSFMSVFNQATHTILQGNRRGANMGVMNIYHPDIQDFIECKNNPDDPTAMQYFNLSVMVDDEFMNAVSDDKTVTLHFPVYNDIGEIEKDESKWTHRKEIRARELWDLVTRRAYESGEPGVFFYDSLNKNNNTFYCEKIIGTNPCGK